VDIMSRKTYLIIAIGVFLIVFLVGTFFGTGIAAFATRLPLYTADSWQNLARLIAEPLRFAMLNPFIGALLAGLFWPVTALLLFLVLVLILLVAASDVATQIERQTPLEVR
jgi:hypothetical protein